MPRSAVLRAAPQNSAGAPLEGFFLMATDTATDTVAAKADDVDVVSMALADLGMTPEPAKEPEDKTESEEKLSDNSDETPDPEEKSEESGEDPVTEPEEETDEEEPADTEAEPQKDKVQKRIDKLVAKQRESEERATAVSAELEQLKSAKADLEAQLNQTSRPILSPSADNPLADVDSEDALDQRIQNAQAVRRWALQNSDGTTIKKPDGSEQFVSGEEVKDYLIKADDILTVHAPARRQWINNRMPAVTSAQNLFPDIFKQGTPMNRAYQATIKTAPEMLKIPQHELWIGLALYGEQALMASQNAKAAKAAAEKKVSSKKSESKTPSAVKPVSTSKSATKGSSAAKNRILSGDASMDAIEAFVSEGLL
jgi:hypothetical protein